MITPVVDRRVIREHLDKRRKYWIKPDGTAATGAIADEVIKVLAETYGINVCDSDWS